MPFSRARIIAQVMNLGTYDDIRRLEGAFGRETLADVLIHAEPGWFSPRSWELWRGRLSCLAVHIPDAPPRRRFHTEAV